MKVFYFRKVRRLKVIATGGIDSISYEVDLPPVR